MITPRERFFTEMAGKGDGIVRSNVGFTSPVVHQYGERLDALKGLSPYVDVQGSKADRRERGYSDMDEWGCQWTFEIDGLSGIVTTHPLADLENLDSYQSPDPDDHTDWAEAEKNVREAKEKGEVARGYTDHGFIFLRLTYLRGFENFMVDVMERSPEAMELVRRVEGYWFEIARRWVELGVDEISFGDDLGLQHALPISPQAWREVLGPSFRRIFSYCRENGVYVSLHSDGYVVDIIPDLIDCGVTTLNLQELVNGVDTLAELVKSRVHLHMDVDRQAVTVFGTPEDVDAHILRCIRTLGSPTGGLSTVWGVYPGTPLPNIEAGVKALARYATYWADNES